MENTFYELLEACKDKYSDNIALMTKDSEISYEELYNIVMDLAKKIQSLGLRNKYIVLETKLSKEWIIAYLALEVAGVIVILHEQCFDESNYIGLNIEAKFTARDICDMNNSSVNKYIKPHKDDIATIIYTSGTTGVPKGVKLSQKNIVSDAIVGYLKIGIDLKPGDKTIPVLPTFHMFGITASILSPLYTGLTVYLIDDIRYLLKSFNLIKPKIMFLVPTILKTIIHKINTMANKMVCPKDELKNSMLGENLEYIVCGGAPLDEWIIDKMEEYGVDLFNGYGITECSPVVTVCSKEFNKRRSVGKVNDLAFVNVKIVEDKIFISGDIVTQGYINGDKEAFVVDKDNNIWFNTQDFGYIDDDGYLFITGREKNLIIMDDGNNVSPEELENLIKKNEFIQDTIVYASSIKSKKIICALIKVTDDYLNLHGHDKVQHNIEEVISNINRGLPHYKKINKWKVIKGDFKRNKLNKILRKDYEKYE